MPRLADWKGKGKRDAGEHVAPLSYYALLCVVLREGGALEAPGSPSGGAPEVVPRQRHHQFVGRAPGGGGATTGEGGGDRGADHLHPGQWTM